MNKTRILPHSQLSQILRPRATAALGSVTFCLLLSACSVSPWVKHTERPFADAANLESEHAAQSINERVHADSVHVQNIPWVRMDDAMLIFGDSLSASDIHATEWTYQDRLDLGGSLATTLQLDEYIAVAPVGVSSFLSTRNLYDHKALAATAAQFGADVAVWSRVSAGQTDIIVREPITEYTTGSVKIKGEWESYTETSTAWVPVPARREQWKYSAMFLRTDPSIGTAAVYEPQ